jgi:hypothetical protein
MARIDLWRWSATRVEIDHRSREARLRLEHLEQPPITRAPPTQSWIRRVLYQRGLRLFNRGGGLSRSSKIDPTGARHRQGRHIPAELCSTTTERGPVSESRDRRLNAWTERGVNCSMDGSSTPARLAGRPGHRWTAG